MGALQDEEMLREFRREETAHGAHVARQAQVNGGAGDTGGDGDAGEGGAGGLQKNIKKHRELHLSLTAGHHALGWGSVTNNSL